MTTHWMEVEVEVVYGVHDVFLLPMGIDLVSSWVHILAS